MTSKMDPDNLIEDIMEEGSSAPQAAPDQLIEEDEEEDGSSSAPPFNSSSLMRSSPVPNSEGGSQPEEASQSPVHRPCNRAPPAKRPHR